MAFYLSFEQRQADGRFRDLYPALRRGYAEGKLPKPPSWNLRCPNTVRYKLRRLRGRDRVFARNAGYPSHGCTGRGLGPGSLVAALAVKAGRDAGEVDLSAVSQERACQGLRIA